MPQTNLHRRKLTQTCSGKLKKLEINSDTLIHNRNHSDKLRQRSSDKFKQTQTDEHILTLNQSDSDKLRHTQTDSKPNRHESAEKSTKPEKVSESR